MSFFQAARTCLSKPEFWILTGTSLPPMNVCWAAGFALVARLRRWPNAGTLVASLNVQITYTLALIVPFAAGTTLSKAPMMREWFAPGSTAALVAGLFLGVFGATAVLLLVFFNTRAFAESLHAHPCSHVPRWRLFRE